MPVAAVSKNGSSVTAIRAIPRSTRSTGSNKSPSPRRATTCSGSWRTCRSIARGSAAGPGSRSKLTCIAAPASNKRYLKVTLPPVLTEIAERELSNVGHMHAMGNSSLHANSHGPTNGFQSFGEYSRRNQINLGVTNPSRPHAGLWLTIEAATSDFDSEIEAELRILFQQRAGDVGWPRFNSRSGSSVAQQRLRRSSFAP